MKGKAKSVKGKVNFSSFIIDHSSLVVLSLIALPFTLSPSFALQLPGSGNTIDNPPNFNSQLADIGGIVSVFLQYALTIGGMLALVFLVIGGFRYVISAGDVKGTESARSQITMALVGLFVIFIAYWLAKIVETILGATIL